MQICPGGVSLAKVLWVASLETLDTSVHDYRYRTNHVHESVDKYFWIHRVRECVKFSMDFKTMWFTDGTDCEHIW